MFRHITKILSIALLLAGVTARAETLESLTAEALRNNPELRSFEAGVASAKGGVRTARVYANPELSIAPGLRRTTDASGSQKDFHGNFELSQLFEFPGQTRALKIAIAEKSVALQQVGLGRFSFCAGREGAARVLRIACRSKVTALRRDQVESAKTFVESSRKRAESGYASDFETVKSQAELIAAERGLFDAQGKVTAAPRGFEHIARSRAGLFLFGDWFNRERVEPIDLSLGIPFARDGPQSEFARTWSAGRSRRTHPAFDPVRSPARFRRSGRRSNTRRTNRSTASA